MENTSSNNSKLFKVIVVVLIIGINLLLWGIFWINSENTNKNQLPDIPQVDPKTIPVVVDANHPAVQELTLNYTFVGAVHSLTPVENEDTTSYELVLRSNNEIVPQTFYIADERDISITQKSESEETPLAVTDLKSGDIIEIHTVFDVKNDTESIESIIRPN